MPDDFDKLLDDAENLTMKELDSCISSFIRLKDSELKSLFPKQTDKNKLIQLMQIVRSASSENARKKELVDNISSLADTVLILLGKLT
jgi:hypothetical protein